MANVGEHYTGENGREYFSDKFTRRYNFGRMYQSRYFATYCSKDRVLLDFGCGDGTILRQLPAARKIGIEINPECREKIKEFNATQEVPIEVHDRIDLLLDKTVDVVVSNHCLEHVDSPFHTLKALKRILVLRGILVLVVPFDDWRSPKNRYWRRNDRDFHLYTWSPMNIGNLLTAAGFEVREIRLCTFAWSPKLFWVNSCLGEMVFRTTCHVLGFLKNRREIFCVAHKMK